MTDDSICRQLGVTDADFAGVPADADGVKIVNLKLRAGGGGKDRPARWLAVAMVSLGILAVASATVSYSAQYQMIFRAKSMAAIAALEAGIPDVAALIFATLGIALALHGKRAIRARTLNVASVATSVGMNLLAAGHGWKNLAIWAMPPVAYALASDTAIGVVRAWTIARQKELRETLADEDSTPLAVVGGVLLWVLRLALAPMSTLAGFRSWVLDECPVAPGRWIARLPADHQALKVSATGNRAGLRPGGLRQRGQADRARSPGTRAGAKTAAFLALVEERHGPLADFPLASVSRVCTELAPEVDLNPGAARTALRRHVLSLQNGSTS